MIKNKTLRLLSLGTLIWFIPFVVSFGFYDRTGNLNVSYGLFKCVMIVVSSIVGMYASIRYFRSLEGDYAKEGVIAGMVWLAVNLLLDIVVLVPMAGMSLGQYFSTIGLGYLQIPIICSAIGIIIQKKVLVR